MKEINFYKLDAINNLNWESVSEDITQFYLALIPEPFYPEGDIRKQGYKEFYFETNTLRESLNIKSTMFPFIINPEIVNEYQCNFEINNDTPVLLVNIKYRPHVSEKIQKSHLDNIANFIRSLVIRSNDTII
jgi:hypothetical protein